MNMNIDQVYLDTLHEYLYCHRMLSEYGRYCYRVYRKIVRSHAHDHRAWDGLGQCCQYGYGTAPNLRRAKKYYKKAAKLGEQYGLDFKTMLHQAHVPSGSTWQWLR